MTGYISKTINHKNGHGAERRQKKDPGQNQTSAGSQLEGPTLEAQLGPLLLTGVAGIEEAPFEVAPVLLNALSLPKVACSFSRRSDSVDWMRIGLCLAVEQQRAGMHAGELCAMYVYVHGYICKNDYENMKAHTYMQHTLHCIALHYVTLRYLTLRYATLRYVTLRCVALP